MRNVEYLSPTSLQLFESQPDEFYLRYLADARPPKFAQTLAMAVGSAFDAYIKSYLYNVLFGPNGKDAEKYKFDNIFQAQVESQNRDQALAMGKHCFDEYKECGALADLMLELQGSVDEPRFEFDLKGEVNGYREGVTKYEHGVILMGKPDLKFINANGVDVVYDFKVNGYCGKGTTSPTKGYVKIREKHKEILTWYNAGPHNVNDIVDYRGMKINGNLNLEICSQDWATQLSTYGWLMGSPVGKEIIVGIDQIVGKFAGKKPILRFATHRSKVSEHYQFQVLHRYQHLWNILKTEPFHFFRQLSLEESQLRCKGLDDKAKMFGSPELTADEKMLLDWSR